MSEKQRTSQWWVFHEDKVEEAIKAWLDEMYPAPEPNEAIDWAVAVESFLKSAALKRLGMRKE